MQSQTRLEAYAEEALRTAEIEPLEDGTFAASVPALKGVIAFGDSENSALAELRSVVHDWAKFQRRRGVNVPVLGRENLNDDPMHSSLTG